MRMHSICFNHSIKLYILLFFLTVNTLKCMDVNSTVVNAAIKQTRQQIDSYNKQMTEIDTELSRLNSRHGELEDGLAMLLNKKAAQQNCIKENLSLSGESIDPNSQEAKTLVETLEETSSYILEFKDTLADTNTELKNLTTKKHNLDREIKRCQVDLATMESRARFASDRFLIGRESTVHETEHDSVQRDSSKTLIETSGLKIFILVSCIIAVTSVLIITKRI